MLMDIRPRRDGATGKEPTGNRVAKKVKEKSEEIVSQSK
jgi:hypothetical protein